MRAARAILIRILAVLGLLAASIFLALALAETGIRFLSPQKLLHDPGAFDPDPVLGGTLRPGFKDRFSGPEFAVRWEINEAGYRGPAAGPRRPGVTRIAVVGDSFTFGYGVEEEESYPRRLEAALNAARPGCCEVFNLGAGGYGAVQDVVWLRRNLDRGLDPDVVLLGFYPGNDLSDSVRGEAARRRALEPGARGMPETAAAPPSRTERLKRWLASRLHLYALVSDRFDGLLIRLGLRRVVYPEDIDVLRLPEPPEIAEGWKVVGESLADLSRLARERGFAAGVVGIPMRHQVAPALWRRVQDYYVVTAGAPPEGPDLDAPGRRLLSACRDAGLPLLDLAPAFRADPEPSRLYFRRDQHWTRDGHALAARAIADWIGWMTAAGPDFTDSAP